MVRLTISFIVGIVIAIFINTDIHIPLFISLTLFLGYSFLVFWSRLLSSYKYRWIHGVIISVSLMLSGYEWTIQNTARFDNNHIGHVISDSTSVFIGTLTEPLNERENSYRSTIKVSAILHNDIWINTNGNILLYFAKDSLTELLQYGDEVLISTKVSEVKPPQNPNEYNYKKYLANKSVYHQAYIKTGSFNVLAHNKGNPLKSLALILQKKLLKVLIDNKIEGSEYAVVSAMLLGSRDKIDADLLNAYSGSGAVHILSVSGLHVGLIFILLNFLLYFMDRHKYLKLLKIAIILGIIWFYAAITGFSAAVLRSTTLFSFIVIGQAYNRKINGFNILASSLFFLLIADPYLLTDVGFQLSYLAVIGIMAVYPGIYRVWKPNNLLMDKTWSLICLSIAAQFITAPLAMYYFHQFPNMFILTNLVIIPLTTLIMYVGIGFYAISYIPVVSGWVSSLLGFLVFLLNETVKFVEQLPYAVTRGIYISSIELLFIFILFIFFITYFYTRQKKYLFIALTLALLIGMFNIFNKFQVLSNRKFIVYSINHHSAYDFIDGQSNYFITDSALIKDNKKINFHIQNNWCYLGVIDNNLIALNDSMNIVNQQDSLKPVFIKDNFIQFYDKRIVIVNDKTYKLFSSGKLRTDYIILSNNARIAIKDIIKQFTFQQIIIDSSNSPWRTNKWMEECRELNISAYSVSISGAFIADL